MFYTIGVVKSFAIFTGKHQCRGLFFNKVTLAQVFSSTFYESFKNTFFFTEHPRVAASVILLEGTIYHRKNLLVILFLPREQTLHVYMLNVKLKNELLLSEIYELGVIVYRRRTR